MGAATVSTVRPGARDRLLAELRAGGVAVTPRPPVLGAADAFRCAAGRGRLAIGFCEVDATPFVAYSTPALLWPWQWSDSAALLARFDQMVARHQPTTAAEPGAAPDRGGTKDFHGS